MEDLKRKINDILKRIRAARIEKGYSLENVGDFLGITKTAYGKVESGTTVLTLERLHQIASFLGMCPVKLQKENCSDCEKLQHEKDLLSHKYDRLVDKFVGD